MRFALWISQLKRYDGTAGRDVLREGGLVSPAISVFYEASNTLSGLWITRVFRYILRRVMMHRSRCKSGAFKTLKNNRKMHLERGTSKPFQPKLCHMEMAALSDTSVGTTDIPIGSPFCTMCYAATGRSYTGQEHSSSDRAQCPIVRSN